MPWDRIRRENAHRELGMLSAIGALTLYERGQVAEDQEHGESTELGFKTHLHMLRHARGWCATARSNCKREQGRHSLVYLCPEVFVSNAVRCGSCECIAAEEMPAAPSTALP